MFGHEGSEEVDVSSSLWKFVCIFFCRLIPFSFCYPTTSFLFTAGDGTKHGLASLLSFGFFVPHLCF